MLMSHFTKEAQCLHENGFYARAYLSAYYTMEEFVKITMIVGALGKLVNNNEVDWKKLNKRFRNSINKNRVRDSSSLYIWNRCIALQ